MKNHAKKKLILLLFGFVFGLSILAPSNFNRYQENVNRNLKNDNEPELKRAGFWEIGPIEIDDDDPTRNWLITEATYDWCSGSGTINDPYVIENVTIDGTGSMDCISIRDSNTNFVIKNCTLYNANSAGFGVKNTKYGQIINNNCSNNRRGIRIEVDTNEVSAQNIVNDNVLNNNDEEGLRIISYSQGICNYNNISNNEINHNDRGIVFYAHSDGTINYNCIWNNSINYNTDKGIYFSTHNNEDNSLFICSNRCHIRHRNYYRE